MAPFIIAIIIAEWTLLTVGLAYAPDHNGTRESSANPYVFEGFDCSTPLGIQDLGHAIHPSCLDSNSRVKEKKEVTYQLLQQVKFHRTAGYSCEMERTQVGHYCGTYDHMTTYGDLNYYNRPVPVAVDVCRDWIWKLKYVDALGQPHELGANTTTIIKYEEVGRTYAENGEVSCVGGDLQHQRQMLHRMVLEVQIKITLRPEVYKSSKTVTYAHIQDRQLPCRPDTGSCQLSDITYFWEIPDLSCDLVGVKYTRGEDILTTNGDSAFVSTDGTLVRLVKAEPISKCDRVVTKTDYENLFLYEVKTNSLPFDRSMDPAEMDVVMFITNRDEFLYQHVADELDQELQGMLRNTCERQARQGKLEFWLQNRDPGLTSWFLGNGTFATAAGEVLYQYQCSPVLVRGASLDRCYQALPVNRLDSTGQALPSDRQLFMEPLTRRLTWTGIELPCQQEFLPKYRNLQNGWVVATPRLHVTTEPVFEAPLTSRNRTPRKRLDFTRGGLYDEQQARAWQHSLDFSRTIIAIGATFAQQVDPQWRNSQEFHLRPENVFPEFKDPTAWASQLWSQTVTFLHLWGETAAIIFSLVTFYRIGATILAWVYSLVVLRDVHGCGRALWWIPCPQMFLLRQYRVVNRGRKRPRPPVPPMRLGNEEDNDSGYEATAPHLEGGTLYPPTAPCDDPKATREKRRPGPPLSGDADQ
jgi:hypothetical protein